MAFTTILAAVDGGAQTQQVLDLALSVARSTPDAVIHVLCIVDPLPTAAGGMAGAIDLAVDILDPQAHQTANDATAYLAQHGARTEAHVEFGNSAQVIVAQAEKLGCGLIVLGHRHMTLWRRIFDPSTCTEVLEDAPCPLLVAAERQRPAPASQ